MTFPRAEPDVLDKVCWTPGCGKMTHAGYCADCNRAALLAPATTIAGPGADGQPRGNLTFSEPKLMPVDVGRCPPASYIATGLPIPLPPVDESDEAHVQAACIDLMQGAGWVCYRIGQKNAKGTQDPGVADTFNVHEARMLMVWIEYKDPDDSRLSDKQREFRKHVVGAGGRYWVIHSRAELVGQLAGLP